MPKIHLVAIYVKETQTFERRVPNNQLNKYTVTNPELFTEVSCHQVYQARNTFIER